VSKKTVFISYSHDSPEHSERVLSLALALRENGVDVELDQFHNEEILDWPRWCNEQTSPERSEFVVCVCTAEYRRRIEGRVPPEKGKGAYWEGSLLDDDLYDDKGNGRVIPILLDDEPESSILRFLRGWTLCRIRQFALNDSGYEHLIRILTAQVKVKKNPLGTIPVLPTATEVLPVQPTSAATELTSPQEFVDRKVRPAARKLQEARKNGTLTMRTLMSTLNDLFDRATFYREAAIGECQTQEWDQRLHSALQTLRLLEEYKAFVEAKAAPAFESYSQLLTNVSKYCERMAAHLFNPVIGLAEFATLVGTDQFIPRVHPRKNPWREGGADPATCAQIDPYLQAANACMQQLYHDFVESQKSHRRLEHLRTMNRAT
jgi:TIR domain